MGDHELLQAYTQQGSQRAFADLVRRYLDLVYSAARRQVRASHLAEEVTQNVFIDLARSAKKLKPSQPLAAWLFLVTRRKAIDALRSEARRHSRTEMLVEEAAQNPSGASGTIDPLLDEAVASLGELRAQRETALKRLASTESELAAFKNLGAGDPAIESALEAWLDRVSSLSKWLERMPDKRIPEMRFLTEEDWLEAAKNAKFGSDLEARESLAKLRGLALDRFGAQINSALAKYRKETEHRVPPAPDTLLAYFDPPIDPAILQNYEIVDREKDGVKLVDLSGKTPKMVLRNKIVDDIHDVRRSYLGGGGAFYEVVNLSQRAIEDAVREYRRVNNGQSPSETGQITPYLKRPIHQEYLKQSLKDAAKIR